MSKKGILKQTTTMIRIRLLKLSFYMVIFCILFSIWTYSGPHKRLVNVLLKNVNYLVKETGENTTKKVEADFDMNGRQQYDLRIICIVYNRAKSLLRLLISINEAEYYNDKIKLEVWIDCSIGGKHDPSVLNVANNFTFRHGSYSVNPHPTHVGIYGQWLSTWKPVANSSEIAVILEDDVVVSPLFYKYLKLVHNKYDSYPSINGYSIQGMSRKHAGIGGQLVAPYKDPVFVYPCLGPWGFSPSTNNWIKFLKWYEGVPADFKPYVPDNKDAKNWFTGVRGPNGTVWTVWHIYFAWKNNEVTMFPNFEGHHGLSANMYEQGLHFGPKGKNQKPSNPLLKTWKPEYENLPDKPVQFDIKGRIVKY